MKGTNLNLKIKLVIVKNMKKKSTKIVSIVILMLLIFTIFSSVYAATCPTCKGSGLQPHSNVNCQRCSGTGKVRGATGTIDTDNFKPGELTDSDYEEAFSMTATIVGAITTVGVVVAVVGIVILGIKYMMGSVEQKADYKKTMIPYLVGCILIFCTSTIVSIIYRLASQL